MKRLLIVATGLMTSMPVYVTRPHGRDGKTVSYSMSLWMSLLAMLLLWLNVVVWGVVGVYAAVRVIV